MDATNGGLIGNIIGWWRAPFDPHGSALSWVLFLGLIVIGLWFWERVVSSINE